MIPRSDAVIELRNAGMTIMIALALIINSVCIPAVSQWNAVYAYDNTYSCWFDALNKVANNVEDKGFWYSNSNNSRSYSGALKNHKVTNCARYVSWALQEFKIIDKHTVFWIKKGGGIGGNASSIRKNSKLTILHPGKRAAKCGLKPGDICGWKNFQHTAVYAGKDSKGNMLWYSAGRDGCKKSGSKYYFKAGRIIARKRAARYDGTISTVIRIKNLKESESNNTEMESNLPDSDCVEDLENTDSIDSWEEGSEFQISDEISAEENAEMEADKGSADDELVPENMEDEYVTTEDNPDMEVEVIDMEEFGYEQIQAQNSINSLEDSYSNQNQETSRHEENSVVDDEEQIVSDDMPESSEGQDAVKETIDSSQLSEDNLTTFVGSDKGAAASASDNLDNDEIREEKTISPDTGDGNSAFANITAMAVAGILYVLIRNKRNRK